MPHDLGGFASPARCPRIESRLVLAAVTPDNGTMIACEDLAASRHGATLVLPGAALRRALAEPLAGAGFDIRDQASDEAADLVLLDRDEGGAAAGDEAAIAAGCPLPVIALRGPGDLRPPAGLPGQVTLMDKPARLAALVALIESRLAPGTAPLAIGPARLYSHAKTLLGACGQAVRLTGMEQALLVRLLGQDGQSVARETLLREVFGYRGDAQTHTVETHVYRLRRKLGAVLDGAESLLCADAGGYRLGAGAQSLNGR